MGKKHSVGAAPKVNIATSPLHVFALIISLHDVISQPIIQTFPILNQNISQQTSKTNLSKEHYRMINVILDIDNLVNKLLV